MRLCFDDLAILLDQWKIDIKVPMDSLLVFLDLPLFDAWKKFQTYSTLNSGETW